MQEAAVHTILRRTYFALIVLTHLAISCAVYALAAWALGAIVALLAVIVYNGFTLHCIWLMDTSGVYVANAIDFADKYAPRVTCKLNTAINWLRSKAPVAK